MRGAAPPLLAPASLSWAGVEGHVRLPPEAAHAAAAASSEEDGTCSHMETPLELMGVPLQVETLLLYSIMCGCSPGRTRCHKLIVITISRCMIHTISGVFTHCMSI